MKSIQSLNLKMRIIKLFTILSLTGLLVGCSGPLTGYKGVVATYFKAIQNSDPALMRSITSEAWLTYMQEGWHYNDQQILEAFESPIENTRHHHPADDNIKFSYEIVKTVKAEGETLLRVEMDLYDRYGREHFTSDTYKVTEAYALDISYSIIGGTEEEFWGWTKKGFLVIKENGKWKALILGDRYDSWY